MPFITRGILFIISFFCCYVSLWAEDGGRLSFISNRGQWDKQVLYKADVQGGAVYFMQGRFRYNFHSQADVAAIHDDHPGNLGREVSGHAYDVIFAGSRPESIDGGDKADFYHNYFLGNDESKWAANVPVFQNLAYNRLYPGIDMQVYSKGSSLKYDLLVQPGGDVSNIRLKFDGVQPVVDENGDLVIVTSVNTVVEQAPYAYQVIDGIETQVPCKYIMVGDELRFDFPGGYDKTMQLVIDPVLRFATYTGSTGQMWGYCTTFDAMGNVYAAVEAYSTGFPTTLGAYRTIYNYRDIAINKYDSAGSKLIFSTYCGGSFPEYPTNIMVNGYNELVITGRTLSADYPVTVSAAQPSYGGSGDIFVTVLNQFGSSLVGSTFMGGTGDDGHSSYALHFQDSDKSGLALDDNGNIFIATSTTSKDFPVTNNAFQKTPGSSYDGCIFKLNRNCSSLLFSTLLGGDHQDCIYDCKLMKNGNVVVCGMSISSNFPLGFAHYSDTGKAFVCVFNTNGSALLASTKLGAKSEAAVKISLDDNDNIFVCGNNDSSFAVSAGTYQQQNGRIFIAKMKPYLDSMLFSTKMVDISAPGVTGFATVCGDVIVSTYLNKANTNLPVTNNAYQATSGVYYFFHLSAAMDSLIYSTYFGVNNPNCHSHGTANVIDSNGVIWASACVSLVKDSLEGTTGSYCSKSLSTNTYSDFLSAKFDMQVLPAKPLAKANIPDTVCAGFDVYFDNKSSNAYCYIWYFGDGDTSHAKAPVHKYDTSGYYMVKLMAYNAYSCRAVDSLVDTVYVDTNRIVSSFLSVDTACIGSTVHFYNTSQNGITTLWDYGDGNTSNTHSGQHMYSAAGNYRVRLVSYNPDYCNKTDTVEKILVIDTVGPGASFTLAPGITCADRPVLFTNNTPRGVSYIWSFGDGQNAYVKNPAYAYNTGGKHTVRLIATNNKLCKPSDTAYGIVEVLPPLQIDLVDSFICGGDEPVEWGIKLIHVNSNPTFKWEPANAIMSGAQQSTAIVDPRIAKKYFVTVTDSILGMCSHTRRDTAVLTVVEYPDSVFAISNSPVCEGDELKLQGGTSSGIPLLTFSWKGPDGFNSSGKFSGRESVKRNQAGKYTIAVSNQGCVTEADADVIVKPKPGIQAYSNSPVWTGNELKLTMSSDLLLDSFFWTGPAGFYSTERNPVIKPVTLEAAGSYVIRGWYDGCLAGDITVASISVTDSQYIRLYPNPNNGTFYLEGKGYHEQEIKMLVVNSVGQRLYRANINTEKKHFKHRVVLPPLAAGVYIIWVLMDGEYRGLTFTILGD